jgi:hypothetical protein
LLAEPREAWHLRVISELRHYPLLGIPLSDDEEIFQRHSHDPVVAPQLTQPLIS